MVVSVRRDDMVRKSRQFALLQPSVRQAAQNGASTRGPEVDGKKMLCIHGVCQRVWVFFANLTFFVDIPNIPPRFCGKKSCTARRTRCPVSFLPFREGGIFRQKDYSFFAVSEPLKKEYSFNISRLQSAYTRNYSFEKKRLR